MSECLENLGQQAESLSAGAAASEPPEPLKVAPAEDELLMPLRLEFDDCQAAPAGEESDDDSEARSEAEHDCTLCACCQAEPRVDRNIYGAECKKALNNVEKRRRRRQKRKAHGGKNGSSSNDPEGHGFLLYYSAIARNAARAEGQDKREDLLTSPCTTRRFPAHRVLAARNSFS